MTPYAINQILESGPIEFDAPDAVMRLAWRRLAQEYWSACYFTAPIHELRRDLGEQLKKAWRDVRKVRADQAKRAAAEPEVGATIAGLIEQRRLLENKPLSVNIGPMQNEIDRKIAAIIAAI